MNKVYVSHSLNLAIKVISSEFEYIKGTSGEMVKVEKKPGKIVRFSNGKYSTSDPVIIDALEKSRSFGTSFFDLNKQQNEAKKAEEKIAAQTTQVVEGARTSDRQVKRVVEDEGVEAPAPVVKRKRRSKKRK